MQLKLLHRSLDEFRKIDEITDEEYWYARDLWEPLGYSSWRNLKDGALIRAIESCKTSGEDVNVHFAEVRKKQIRKNQHRETEGGIDDIRLTRYACYLITQNGDPSIPEIAFAQMYFAVQTRKQEVLERNIEELERMITRKRLGETEKEFVKVIYERGVDNKGIGAIRNAGHKALFSYGTKEMKSRLGIKEDSKQALADVLPSVTLKAMDLATEMTTVNTKRKGLNGKPAINMEHIQNNMGVRKALTNQGIYPEKLPADEDIKVIEERYKKQIEPKTNKLLGL